MAAKIASQKSETRRIGNKILKLPQGVYPSRGSNRGVKRSVSHVVNGSHCCQNYNGSLWG